MIIRISSEFDGRLLRSYLKNTLGLSIATVAHLKNHERGMMVNGSRVTVRYTLRAGDVLELADEDTPDTATEHVTPVDLPLEVLYEDEHVFVLNKPAHMPTHPSHGHLTDTLANALAWRYACRGEPFVFRPMGRLDRNTSGVVIVGKTRAATGCLGNALRRGQVVKRYLAVLDGQLSGDIGHTYSVEAPIYRPEASGIMRAVTSADTPGAEYALTSYRILAVSPQATLVLAEPKTGRTHQLRVHFAHLGHPIMGDEIYGSPSPLIPRHALHALSLSVPLPFARIMGIPQEAKGQIANTPLNRPCADGFLHTRAPLPADMEHLLYTLFPQHAHIPSEISTVQQLMEL